MSIAPHYDNPTCTHERRPGTTVCLLCRQEARVAASARRNKLMLRGAALAIVIAVLLVWLASTVAFPGGSIFGSNNRAATPAPGAAATTPEPAAAAPATSDSAAPGAPSATPTPAATATIAATGPTGATAARTPDSTALTRGTASKANPSPAGAAAPIAPVIATGEHALGNGVTATRTDSGVLVTFDTPELRTRIPEKFERLLRETLAQIYGAALAPALAAQPVGALVAQGDLLYALPTRGIQLPVQAGWHLEVYPEIRPGRDGPLVVRYRAAIAKD